jgi:hypothetical protein
MQKRERSRGEHFVRASGLSPQASVGRTGLAYEGMTRKSASTPLAKHTSLILCSSSRSILHPSTKRSYCIIMSNTKQEHHFLRVAVFARNDGSSHF